MLFLVFTNKFKYQDIFSKFKADEFADFGYDLLHVNAELESHLINEDDTIEEHLGSVNGNYELIIVNDIDISNEDYIQKFIISSFSRRQEIFVLFHDNGYWDSQRSTIHQFLNGKSYIDYFDSHVPDSYYYEELFDLAVAVSNNDQIEFERVMKKIKHSFVRNEITTIRKKLYQPEVLETIDNFSLSTFTKAKLISETNWNDLKAEMKKVYDVNGGITAELNLVINRYLKA